VFDRAAYWHRHEYTATEIARKRRTSNISTGAAVALTFVLFACRGWFAAAPTVAPNPLRVLSAFLNAAFLVFTFVADAFCSQPAEDGSECAAVTETAVGPFAYFTKQALAIQVAHAAASMAAEAFADAPLLAVVHAASTFVACMAIALSLLFLKLCWYEPGWQAEVLLPANKRGIPGSFVALAAHIPSLPCAVFDVAVVKRASLFLPTFVDFGHTATVVVVYSASFVVITNLNYKWSRGNYPYPFMRALTSIKLWAVFYVAIVVLLLCFVLPCVFLLKQLNPWG